MMRKFLLATTIIAFAASPVLAQVVQAPVVKDSSGRNIQANPTISVAPDGTYAGATLPTGSATAARQDTGNASLATIATNTTGAATAANQAAQTTAINNMSAAQGAATAGQTEQLVACSNETSPASATNGTTNPFSCSLTRELRVMLQSGTGTTLFSAQNITDGQTMTPTMLAVQAVGYVYNGTSRDRVRGVQGSDGTGLGVQAANPVACSALTCAIVPSVSANAASTSLILKASAGNYYDGYCKSSVVGNCIAYNSATVPSAGALTASLVLECAPILTAGGVASWSYGTMPRRASAGIVYLFSSSTDCNTYTASSTAYIHGSVQ